MKKRITAAILAGLLAMSAVSCGSGGDTPVNDPSAQTSSQVEETTEAELTDGLPDTNMDGFSLNLLHFDKSWLGWAETMLDVEEVSGDMLDDAVYNRNRSIEDRFNCIISISELPMVNTEAVSGLVMSGDSTYDVLMTYDLWLLGMLQYLMPWNDIPYINFEADWWNPEASDIFTFAGERYSPAGNFSLAVVSRCAGFVYNKVMYQNLGLSEDLYDIVSNGSWTIDKLYEIGSAAVVDVNGDGVYDGSDNYGIYGSNKEFYSRMIQGSGVRYITKDENDYPRFTLPGDELAIGKLQHILDLNASSRAYYNEATNVDNAEPADFFKNGHVLFSVASILGVIGLRDMEDDIGVLPAPKYDESQETYYAPSFGSEVPILPKSFDMSRADNVGMVLEALSFASEQDLIPMYKETLLKTKYARDAGSEAMLDIIFSNIQFEFGINAWQETIANPIIRQVFYKNPDSLVSTLDSMQGKVDGEIEKLIKTLEEN